MSAIKAPANRVNFETHPMSSKLYWPKLDRVVVAIYKHGSDLVGFWSCPLSSIENLVFPEELFTPSLDRSSNIVKIIAPHGSESQVLPWRKRLKMSLELHLYEKNSPPELLYSPTKKLIKVAGKLTQPVIEVIPEKIKVLIIDDSKVIRTLLKEALKSKDNFEVVAETGLPHEVAGLIAKHNPDVMTLDINMPEMNGVELIESLDRSKLPPTVVVSSLNMNEGTLVMRALENGAFDYIQKPSMEERAEFAVHLAEKLTIAAQTRPRLQKTIQTGPLLKQLKLDTNGLIVIGASTGGTEAVKAVLRHLPKNVPPILIVQHIPPVFSRAFAESLDSLCEFNVCEAADGQELEPGKAYVAPGGLQMRLKNVKSGTYSLDIQPGAKISGHAPSVDCLFESVAEVYKGKLIGLLLTGMGADGAKGLLSLKKKNCHTVAQNEETCVVFGMPKQAIKLDAATKVLGLHEMANEIANYFK